MYIANLLNTEWPNIECNIYHKLEMEITRNYTQ
jgi:hypothetical protein